jgi:hypothetical protein
MSMTVSFPTGRCNSSESYLDALSGLRVAVGVMIQSRFSLEIFPLDSAKIL